jgi:glycerol-3-phosphate dehydrogenase (NAD(P)+)
VVASEGSRIKVSVVGAGTMGTTLAHLIAANGHDCVLLTNNDEVVAAVNNRHVHPEHFKGVKLDRKLRASKDFRRALPESDLVIVAVPSERMRKTAREISTLISPRQNVLSVTKGIEAGSNKVMSQILREELGTRHIGTLAGPNITSDLIRGLPSTVVVASDSVRVRQNAKFALSSDELQVRTSSHWLAVEFTSALKNVVAIEVGIAAGLKLGHNFESVVLVEGLAEIKGLLKRMRLDSSGCDGLVGLADLFLTCVSPFAKNYWAGLKIGEGRSLTSILRELHDKRETAEGLSSLRAAKSLLIRYQYPAPLLSAAFESVFRKHNRSSMRRMITSATQQ